jgi:queuine tRNA-ribosyltransferase
MMFKLEKTDDKSNARAGVVKTDHGDIKTPIFMPVGTLATVKTLHQKELLDPVKAQIILGNTYHLYLRPGMEIMGKAGGLHKFMNWEKPLLTDSGGYQVFSLSQQRKIKEEGAEFKSHIDGSKHLFTPENTVDIQRTIGADIIMAFDECTPYPCDYTYAKKSLALTHRWLERGLTAFEKTSSKYGHKQFFAPIVQGSTYKDLRVESAKYIAEKDVEINAIGGLSVGEPAEEMYEMSGLVCEHLPIDKPRYLMGVGTPANLLENIALGIDMFDCVLPTRNARHGMLYTTEGIINIKNAKWKDDFTPIDASLDCPTSQSHTKSYLRHLFISKESLGAQLASLQNLSFFLWLVNEARQQIIAGEFSSWKDTMVNRISVRL